MSEHSELPAVYVLETDPASASVYGKCAQGLQIRLRFFEHSDVFLAEVLEQRPELWIFQIELCQAAVERQTELTRHRIYSSAVATVAHCGLAAVIRVMEQGAISVMEKPLTRPRVQQALKKGLLVAERERELQRIYDDFATKYQALTNRQRCVLAGVVNGKPTKLIAAELDVSSRLVELERAQLIRAFEVDANAELAQRYGEYLILKRLRTVSVPAPHINFAGLRRKLGKLHSR